MTEQQRQTDNMLLQMIQRHFPSLPHSDQHTDWPKWLGFARAAYDAGAAAEREACAKEMERLREIESAAKNLCRVRGRHHSELAMRRVMQACGFQAAND